MEGVKRREGTLLFDVCYFLVVSTRICTFAIKGKAKRLKEVDTTSTLGTEGNGDYVFYEALMYLI